MEYVAWAPPASPYWNRADSIFPPGTNYGQTGSVYSNNRSYEDGPPPNFAPGNEHGPEGHYQAQHGLPEQPQIMFSVPQYRLPPPTGQRPKRAAQACESCRQRKAKCDEGRPECSHCKENSLECVYRDLPPQKQDKQAAALTEKLNNIDRKISTLVDQDDQMDRIIRLQEAQAQQIEGLQVLLLTDTCDKTMSTPPVKDKHAGAHQSSVNHTPAAPPIQTGNVYELTIEDAQSVMLSDKVNEKIWLTCPYNTSSMPFITICITPEFARQFIQKRPKIL